uniref:Ankyrin 5 n=1 Tax=Microplitis similis bracovirus TaxID=2487141 RepID=A0A3G4R8S8_9VIRU|nr:ankyrin 5 [Microplitis similis bracovirus]
MAENGHFRNGIDFVELINQEGHTFHYICRAGNINELVDMVPVILQNRDLLFQYDHEGKQCTHIAAEYDVSNAMMKIELLVMLGADINSRELNLGNTLLHIAAGTENYQLADWLCEKPGVELGAINFLHKTAYHIAYERQNARMMEILRVNGAVCDDPIDLDESDETSSESIEGISI